MSAATLRHYVERLDRISRSPGAAVDLYDRAALEWAHGLALRELARVEADERARRAEDDTRRIGP